MASIANKFAAAATANSVKKVLDNGSATKAATSAVNTTAAAKANATNSVENVSKPKSSVENVVVGNSQQQAIKDQMAANSKAWHTADAQERSRLEQANKDLAAQLGGLSFDSGSGTWSGTATAPVQQPTVQAPSYQTEDYSNYLEEMYAAKKKGALAQLDAAYKKNVSALDAARDNLAPGYRDARNQAAANSAMSGRNFAEYAAASGLNSGAKVQAELARNVALQNDLGSIDRQEAQSLADLELQRTQMETEYNAAISQAEASGDYELAAALYQEKVRQSEAALQQQMLLYQQQRDAVADSQWQKQFDFNVGQAGTADTQWQAEMDYKNNAYRDQMQNANRSQLANFGSNFLKNGVMPSQEMLNAMGITAEDAQSYLNAMNLQASVKAAGSGGTGSSGSTKPALTWPQTLAEIEKGNLTANVLSAYQYYMGQDYSAGSVSGSGTVGSGTPSPNYGFQALVSQLSELEDRLNPSAVPARAAALIRSAYENGSITENAAKRLLSQYGMN